MIDTMKCPSSRSGLTDDPFAETFESEEIVHDRRPGQPVRTCFEAKPTPKMLALLFGDLPHPSVSDTPECDAAVEVEPEPSEEEREAA